MKRRALWKRYADALDASIDLWPATGDDVVDDLVATADPWADAPLRTDAAIVRAARCVDLEAAAGRLSFDQVVTLYDAIAAVAGSGYGWQPAAAWGPYQDTAAGDQRPAPAQDVRPGTCHCGDGFIARHGMHRSTCQAGR